MNHRHRHGARRRNGGPVTRNLAEDRRGGKGRHLPWINLRSYNPGKSEPPDSESGKSHRKNESMDPGKNAWVKPTKPAVQAVSVPTVTARAATTPVISGWFTPNPDASITEGLAAIGSANKKRGHTTVPDWEPVGFDE